LPRNELELSEETISSECLARSSDSSGGGGAFAITWYDALGDFAIFGVALSLGRVQRVRRGSGTGCHADLMVLKRGSEDCISKKREGRGERRIDMVDGD